jgi:hypothetical protein
LFQRLTDRDAENREIRRPTPLAELKAVALQAASATGNPVGDNVVDDVVAAFSAPGCAFAVINAQEDVDISHESFIRRWARLRDWVDQESRSRRVYVKLADIAAAWQRGEASLYRGPELAEARQWWDRETPTQSWANRYDSRFEGARRFLLKSVRGRRLRLGLVLGNVALLLVGAVVIAALMAISSSRAKAAAAAALEARNATFDANKRLEEANRLIAQAVDLQREGKSSQAAALVKQAQQVQDAKAASTLTQSELSELDRLRREQADWRRTEADLRKQLATSRTVIASPPVTAATSDMTTADRAELERLRSAQADWDREGTRLRQQLAAANDRLKSQQASVPVRENTVEPRTAPAPAALARVPDTTAIQQVLRDYQAAYTQRDAAAVARLVPSAKTAELERSFSQLRAYEMEILDSRISVTGDTAVVSCVRRISIDPRAGARPAPRSIPTVMRLKQSGGVWTIESVEEER